MPQDLMARYADLKSFGMHIDTRSMPATCVLIYGMQTWRCASFAEAVELGESIIQG